MENDHRRLAVWISLHSFSGVDLHYRSLPYYLAVAIILPFLPSSILSNFASIDVFVTLCDRNLADLIYIKSQSSQEFLDSYVGVYVLQLIISSFYILIICVFMFFGKPIYYTDKESYYSKALLGIFILLLMVCYGLFFNSDFGYRDGLHSWFEDSYSHSRKYMPLPMTTFASMFVSLHIMIIGFCLSYIIRLIFLIFYGARKIFDMHEV